MNIQNDLRAPAVLIGAGANLDHIDDKLIDIVIVELVQLRNIGDTALVQQRVDAGAARSVAGGDLHLAEIEPALAVGSSVLNDTVFDLHTEHGDLGSIGDSGIRLGIDCSAVDVEGHDSSAGLEPHVVVHIAADTLGGLGIHPESHIHIRVIAGTVMQSGQTLYGNIAAGSAGENDLRGDGGKGGQILVGVGAHGVVRIGNVCHILNDEVIGAAAAEVDRYAISEQQFQFARIIHLHRDILKVDPGSGTGSICIMLDLECGAVVRHIPELNGLFQFRSQSLLGIGFILAAGSRFINSGVEFPEGLLSVRMAHALAEDQLHIGFGHGLLAFGIDHHGELLTHGRRGIIQRVDRDHLDHFGVVSGLVLCQIVDIIGRGRLEAADLQRNIRAGLGGDLADLDHTAHAVDHLQDGLLHGVGIIAGRIKLLVDLDPIGEVLVVQRHYRPVDGTHLVHGGGEVHGILLNAGNHGILQDGRCSVHGGEGEFLHTGILAVVGIDQAQVEIIALQLIQLTILEDDLVAQSILTVDLVGQFRKGNNILGDRDTAGGAVAQITGHRIRLEIGNGRCAGALGQNRIVELTALGGHDCNLCVILGDEGQFGITAGKTGRSSVGGSKGNIFDRALLVAAVHQNSAHIVGTVRDQLRNLDFEFLIGSGHIDRALLQDLVAVILGFQKIVLTHRTIDQTGQCPVNGTLLVGAEDDLSAGRRDILDLGIACKDSGFGGGFVTFLGIHLHAVDVSGQAGTNGDLVGQHVHD